MNEIPAEDRLRRLLARLRSDDEAVRIHAALRLSGMDFDPALVRPALSEALADPDQQVRRLAAWALARLAVPAAA